MDFLGNGRGTVSLLRANNTGQGDIAPCPGWIRSLCTDLMEQCRMALGRLMRRQSGSYSQKLNRVENAAMLPIQPQRYKITNAHSARNSRCVDDADPPWPGYPHAR
jgi:hypothetical protein